MGDFAGISIFRRRDTWSRRLWRGDGILARPAQALYTAIKFPLVILLTTLGNAFLNAMVAPLLGLNISLRQSFMLC